MATYDEWKLRSPYEDDGAMEPPCSKCGKYFEDCECQDGPTIPEYSEEDIRSAIGDQKYHEWKEEQ